MIKNTSRSEVSVYTHGEGDENPVFNSIRVQAMDTSTVLAVTQVTVRVENDRLAKVTVYGANVTPGGPQFIHYEALNSTDRLTRNQQYERFPAWLKKLIADNHSGATYAQDGTVK